MGVLPARHYGLICKPPELPDIVEIDEDLVSLSSSCCITDCGEDSSCYSSGPEGGNNCLSRDEDGGDIYNNEFLNNAGDVANSWAKAAPRSAAILARLASKSRRKRSFSKLRSRKTKSKKQEVSIETQSSSKLTSELKVEEGSIDGISRSSTEASSNINDTSLNKSAGKKTARPRTKKLLLAFGNIGRVKKSKFHGFHYSSEEKPVKDEHFTDKDAGQIREDTTGETKQNKEIKREGGGSFSFVPYFGRHTLARLRGGKVNQYFCCMLLIVKDELPLPQTILDILSVNIY